MFLSSGSSSFRSQSMLSLFGGKILLTFLDSFHVSCSVNTGPNLISTQTQNLEQNRPVPLTLWCEGPWPYQWAALTRPLDTPMSIPTGLCLRKTQLMPLMPPRGARSFSVRPTGAKLKILPKHFVHTLITVDSSHGSYFESVGNIFFFLEAQIISYYFCPRFEILFDALVICGN